MIFRSVLRQQAIRKACNCLKISYLRHHDLRHYFATQAVQSGVDMPTIGPNTIKNVVKANLSGIAITADNVIVLDFQKVIEMIEDNNLYFIVI